MPADPAAVKAVFLEAVDLTPADRAAFLAGRCGTDADLLRRVNALLAAHDRIGVTGETACLDAADSAATRSLGDGTRPVPAPTETAGQVIAGRYKLIERIAEGGMGSVWMAEQTEPVRRKVALKLIKVGLDTKQVLARFEAERQALALMEHENIAKVFDGGLDEGRPYFVMELVKGIPITHFCDARKLTPQQRLELFVPVCQAIQHAHQKGVIHRDIKPANVLVALYDDKPVPKVIDFGVAKATGVTLTEHTLNTGFGAIIGTPQYMSPEQATFNNLDIDTRSDVYSLGVLLYELLAGSPPFKRKEMEKRGLMEMLRVVREEEPPRPSTKLSTADALPSLAANRGMEPKKLTGLLRNELDWIVMKALEKERDRRYETANGFAADVLRYLSGEPVQAHPPTAAYRLRKFVRKHQVPVVAGSVVLLTLLAGITGTTLGLIEANRQAGIARQETEAKEKAYEAESRQRATAEKNEQMALAAARAEGEAKKKEAEHRLRAEAAYARLADAIDTLVSEHAGKSLAEQKALTEDQKKLLTESLTYYREFAAAAGEDEKARARIARAALQVGRIESRLGRKEEGVAALKLACDGFEKLAADFPAVTEYRSKVAQCHNNLGNLLDELGKGTEAEEQFGKGIAGFEKLTAEFPAVAEHRCDLAKCHGNLGNLLRNLGKRTRAEEQFQKARTLQAKLAADFPAAAEYRSDLAATHNTLAILLNDQGKYAEAEEQFKNALALFEKLAAQFPAVAMHQSELGGAQCNLGSIQRILGKLMESDEQFRKALAVRGKLTTDFPAVPVYRSDLAITHNGLGLLLNDRGKRVEAEEQYQKARAILEKLAADYPAIPEYGMNLGVTCCNLGNLVREEKPADSLAWYRKSIDVLEPIYNKGPRNVTVRQYLRNSYWARAGAFDRLEKYTDAAKDWDKAVELCSEEFQPVMRTGRAMSRLRAGRAADAVADVAAARVLPEWPADDWYNFACVYSVASAKIADKKQEYAGVAMEMLRKAVKEGYMDSANMKADEDLDPLRERDDFKKLLADLEAKFPPKKEVLPAPRADK